MFFLFEKVPHLVIRIDNSEPIGAEDFAALFQALSRDYRRISKGGTLSIGRVQEGSIVVMLYDAAAWAAPHVKDAAAIATAANSLKGLYISISGLFVKTQRKKGIRTREAGFRSVQKIAAIGVAAKANVDVSFRSSDGDELKATITFDQAKQMNENVGAGPARLSERIDTPPALGMQLERLLHLDDEMPGASYDLQNAIAELVNLLRGIGLIDSVHLLAGSLKQKGRPDLAILLIEAAQRSRHG